MKVNGLYNNQSLNNDIKAKRDIKPKKSSIHRFNGFLTSERLHCLQKGSDRELKRTLFTIILLQFMIHKKLKRFDYYAMD